MKQPTAAAGLALVLLLAPVGAQAQDWDEAYRSGLTALARGDNVRAADALRRAILLHPEPGRNVPTYGTNVEPRYFPYLRLAEACLALGQLEAAREALEKSASFGPREPADERQKLIARLEAASAPRRSPVPTAPPPTAAPAAPSGTPVVAVPSATPAPVTIPSVTAVPSATPPAPREGFHPGHVNEREPRLPAESASRAPVAPAVDTGTLEIVSQPPGATTYVDDEPVGATDPQTGRLVKTGVRPGRHHVRLTRAGHEDAVGDVDVARGEAAVFHATLAPLSAGAPVAGAGLVVFALVAIGLVAVFAWMALRRRRPRLPATGRRLPAARPRARPRLRDK